MPSCSDPTHRHRTDAAALKCERVRQIYREANPADPAYKPHSERCVRVPQQGRETPDLK